MEIKTTLEIKERNGEDLSYEKASTIVIKTHPDYKEWLIIVVGGNDYTIEKKDMILAMGIFNDR